MSDTKEAKTSTGAKPEIDPDAVKRVTDPMPIPDTCNICHGPNVELVNNAVIYGREYGKWPFSYLCHDCGSYVGVHENTDIPMGTLATSDIRMARQKYKVYFQKLCKKNRHMGRGEVYDWLAKQMGIPESQCHWSMFDAEQAKKAGEICLKGAMGYLK